MSSYGAAEGVAATGRAGVEGRGGLSSGSAAQVVSSVVYSSCPSMSVVTKPICVRAHLESPSVIVDYRPVFVEM